MNFASGFFIMVQAGILGKIERKRRIAMEPFMPSQAYFEPNALNYPLGRELYNKLEAMSVPIFMTPSHNRITGITGKNAQECYCKAKRILAVGVRRSLNFQSCKPSAHFQLPLNTGCPSMCEYCYLMTILSKRAKDAVKSHS
jgi:spore photoproduct lyase